MSIDDNIRKRRKELKLTQTKLGQLVHKSSQVISNWERGYTTGITIEDLIALSDH
ncbi:helix-turn-helix transcriptional regulator [Mitsuokella jalaludinii]|uniref:helix-turn-helix domain-containing protein n=1 Tax=Mitsuokella jalaludinii TaxID=187979 RepID=UPI001D0104E0|nr:helix-turn-helix transcriptional regulator [Mitsuokella jalaludinii]MCB5725497.1 helix-turn-helix transcriptional regulator [Mitsuokella jalaludinii]